MSPELARRLRAAAAAMPSGAVPLRALTDAHGGAAHPTLLMLLAAPCLLPVPGVGTMLSLALGLLAVLIWRRDPAQPLPDRIARVELPAPWARKVLHLLARGYELSARITRPRWPALTGPSAVLGVAAGTAAMALLIFLPIPFGNLLPALSLMLAGLALASRDGLWMLLALAASALALLTSAAFLAIAWQALAALF